MDAEQKSLDVHFGASSTWPYRCIGTRYLKRYMYLQLNNGRAELECGKFD